MTLGNDEIAVLAIGAILIPIGLITIYVSRPRRDSRQDEKTNASGAPATSLKADR